MSTLTWFSLQRSGEESQIEEMSIWKQVWRSRIIKSIINFYSQNQDDWDYCHRHLRANYKVCQYKMFDPNVFLHNIIMVAKPTIMMMTMIMMVTTMMMIAMSKAERVWLRWRRTREPARDINNPMFATALQVFRRPPLIQRFLFSCNVFFFIFPNLHKRLSEGKPCHPSMKHLLWSSSESTPATKIKDFVGSKKGKRRNLVSLLTTLFLVWYSFVLQSKL